ncbi:MAG: ROK family protein [Thermodesulfovibrionaceae bacterium]
MFYYIGVDIGGTNIRIGVVSDEWEIIALYKFSTTKEPFETVVKHLEVIFDEYTISGLGIGVAGVVDKEGNVIVSPNIPSFNNFPLKKEITKKFLVPTLVENDANVATVAEALFGEGRDAESFILLTLGTGIGGGLWSSGKLSSFPIEVGHMSINYQGKSCTCGSNGCLEIYASAKAIKDGLIEKLEKGQESYILQLYEGNFYKVVTEDIYRFALEGDPLCRGILKEAGKALGAGVANLINLFAPDKIILTGGLSKAEKIYIDTAKQEIKKRSLEGLFNKVKIVQSSLVDKGGVLGAVALLKSKSGVLCRK